MCQIKESLESQIKDLESTIEIEKNNSKKLDEELDKFKVIKIFINKLAWIL